jgi:hypothetical protein
VRIRTDKLEVEVGARAAGHEGLLESLGSRAHDAVVKGELDVGTHVLAQAHTLGTLEHHGRGHGSGTHDLHVGETRPVARGNILVHLGDGAVDRHVAVLPVHVVVAGTGIITHPDAVGRHRLGLLLAHLHKDRANVTSISVRASV